MSLGSVQFCICRLAQGAAVHGDRVTRGRLPASRALVTKFSQWLRETSIPVAVFVLLVLGITAIDVFVSSKSAQIGTFRPLSTVPPKIEELVVAGAALGLVACIPLKRLDATLITLSVAFLALIDLDHLPSAFGFAQPIRPAHSFAFVVLEVAVLALVESKKPEVPLIGAAAWFGHMAGDTGIFALFAPFSFEYYTISSYTILLVLASVAFGLAAGFVKRRSKPVSEPC